MVMDKDGEKAKYHDISGGRHFKHRHVSSIAWNYATEGSKPMFAHSSKNAIEVCTVAHNLINSESDDARQHVEQGGGAAELDTGEPLKDPGLLITPSKQGSDNFSTPAVVTSPVNETNRGQPVVTQEVEAAAAC